MLAKLLASERDDELRSRWRLWLQAAVFQRQQQKAARRGDWNICTVNDPARSLVRCKRQIDQMQKATRAVQPREWQMA